MDDIIRPVIALTTGDYAVRGIDATGGERLDREFDQALSAEDVVGVVWEAIEHGERLFIEYNGRRNTGPLWAQINLAHVVMVSCRSYDG